MSKVPLELQMTMMMWVWMWLSAAAQVGTCTAHSVVQAPCSTQVCHCMQLTACLALLVWFVDAAKICKHLQSQF